MALKPLFNLDEVREYASERVVEFHQQRMRLLQDLTFQELLEENLCLFRPMCLLAGDIVEGLLEAFICSSDEQLFEDFLKDLSLFITQKAYGGCKSTMSGVDLEFENKDVYYIVSVRSGLNWGNSSQRSKLVEDLQQAGVKVKQSRHGANVQSVLGICYGKTRTSYLRGYLKVVGQNFWYLISENRDLYTDIIEPIGYRAKEHKDAFYNQRDRIINRFTKQFLDEFCDSTGAIAWVRLVEFNSGNYDLDEFLSCSFSLD